MLATGVYIGPAERRVFCWVHETSSGGRPAVVICPPLGYEYTCSYRSLTTLAGVLAEQGRLVVRVDYDGCGNSLGTHVDPDRLGHWIASVEAAISYAMASGASSVCLVGFRFGAAIAVGACSHPSVSHLVLWDPVVSGRRFSRELAAMAAASGEKQPPEDSPTALSVVGQRFTRATLDALKDFDPPKLDRPGKSVLVIERPDRDGATPLVSSLTAAGCQVRSVHLDGTAAMIDTEAEVAQVPHLIVDEIARFVASVPLSPVAPAASPGVATSAEVTGDGWEESFSRIGAAQLAGFWGTTIGSASDALVIFLNNGVAPSTGPARAWVDMSRELNRNGWSTLRLDASGLGDSPTRPGLRTDDTYAAVVVDDVRLAIDAGEERGYRRFFLVGLCAGAFAAIETQLVDARVSAIFALNPQLYVTPRRRRPWIAPWWRPFGWVMMKTPVRSRVLRLPRQFWWILARLWITPFADVSVRLLAKSGRRGTIVFCEDDRGLVDFDRRARRRRSHYALPDSTIDIHVVEDLDHSLFGYGAREKTLSALLDWLGGQPASAPINP